MHWWAQDSAFIQHDACPKLPTKSPPVNTECYNANTCLCDAKGKVTKDCLKQWQSTISKGLEKKAGPLRWYYDDGTLIIEFYSDTCESTFVNTAWLNLTTMRGSFHHLIENQSESRQRAAMAKGHRCLQVADEIGECGFKLVTQTFRDMDLSHAWSIRAWRLVVSTLKLRYAFQPGILEAQRVGWEHNMFGGLRGAPLLKRRRMSSTRAPKTQAALQDAKATLPRARPNLNAPAAPHPLMLDSAGAQDEERSSQASIDSKGHLCVEDLERACWVCWCVLCFCCLLAFLWFWV